MTADASQAPLPLVWFLALCGAVLFAIAVGLLIEGEIKIRRARAMLNHPARRALRAVPPLHPNCRCSTEPVYDLAAEPEAAPEGSWRPDTNAAIRHTVDTTQTWWALDEVQLQRELRKTRELS